MSGTWVNRQGNSFLLVICAVILPLVQGSLAAQDALTEPSSASPHLTCEQMENFIRTAPIKSQKSLPKGVTAPSRATLSDGHFTHDAAIETIHEAKTRFEGTRGIEMNFEDKWEFDVAAYRLARLLDLNMVPPYVERKVGGRSAALSWWVENAIMEADRVKKKMQPPDLDSWNKQMYTVRVLDQLVYDMDDNLTNFLITPDWRLWRIDFTRAFRLQRDLKTPTDLVKCDRRMLAKLRELNKSMLQKALKPYITDMQISGLLARRDKIVEFFDAEVAKKGEGAVLFDIPRTQEACGVGL